MADSPSNVSSCCLPVSQSLAAAPQLGCPAAGQQCRSVVHNQLPAALARVQTLLKDSYGHAVTPVLLM